MKVAIACDHAGFTAKAAVIKEAERLGHEVIDLGTDSCDPVDYPDFAEKLAEIIQNGKAARGILICGSGIGACITANKFKGIRASIAHDTYSAAQGVEHDDMNVLCLGGRVIGQNLIAPLVEKFLNAVFHIDEERHARRVYKMINIEDKNFK
jgi:ribose 5-phosphate isomerase B